MRRIADCGLRIADRLLVSLFCLTTGISAAEIPTITVSKGDRINLSVSSLGGSEGAAATKIVQNDLTLSGYFSVSLSLRK